MTTQNRCFFGTLYSGNQCSICGWEKDMMDEVPEGYIQGHGDNRRVKFWVIKSYQKSTSFGCERNRVNKTSFIVYDVNNRVRPTGEWSERIKKYLQCALVSKEKVGRKVKLTCIGNREVSPQKKKQGSERIKRTQTTPLVSRTSKKTQYNKKKDVEGEDEDEEDEDENHEKKMKSSSKKMKRQDVVEKLKKLLLEQAEEIEKLKSKKEKEKDKPKMIREDEDYHIPFDDGGFTFDDMINHDMINDEISSPTKRNKRRMIEEGSTLSLEDKDDQSNDEKDDDDDKQSKRKDSHENENDNSKKRKRDDNENDKVKKRKKIVDDDEPTVRVCKACGIEKSIDDFKKTKSSRKICHKCYKKINAERIRKKRQEAKLQLNDLNK